MFETLCKITILITLYYANTNPVTLYRGSLNVRYVNRIGKCAGSLGSLVYKQRCTNCKATEHCEQIGSPLPKTSLEDCENQCSMAVGCQMSEYTTRILQPCNLYKCRLVDERSGSTIIKDAPNQDCLQFTVSKENSRKGTCSCLESHSYAANMSYCFDLCLNHLGCRGATLWNNNTCTLHNCSDSDDEREAMFIERICVDCYYPSAPDNGGVELLLPGITTYPGAVAAQSCNNGYVLTGNKTIVCQANGLWTHSVSCIKNDTQCAKILVENCSSCKAAESCGQYLHRWTDLSKEECMVECESDVSCHLVEYTTNRTPLCSLYNCTITKDSSGSETVLYLCNTDCGMPPAPSNGTVMLKTLGVTTYTATATQSCNDGFILVGDPTIQCQASGSWTDSASCFEIETQCKQAYQEECIDCQAAQSCGNYLTITTGDSRLECEEKCNQTINCYLMVYSAERFSKCKLYNCSEVEYYQGSDAIVYSCNSGKHFSTTRHISGISGASTSTTFPAQVASTSSPSTTPRISNGILSTTLWAMSSLIVTTQTTLPYITTIYFPYLTTKILTATETLTNLTTDTLARRITTPKQSMGTSNLSRYHLAPMSTTFKTTRLTTSLTFTNSPKAGETSALLNNTKLTTTMIPATGLPSKLTTTISSLPMLPFTKQKSEPTVISPTKLSMNTPIATLQINHSVLETRTQTQTKTMTRTTPTVTSKLKSTMMLLPTTQTTTTLTKTTTGPTMTKTGSCTLSNKNPSATKASFAHTSITPSFTMAYTSEAMPDTSPKTTLTLRTVIVTRKRERTMAMDNQTNLLTKKRVSTAVKSTTSLKSSIPTRELTEPTHATNLKTTTLETIAHSMASNKAINMTKHTIHSPLSMTKNMTMTMPKLAERENTTKPPKSTINPVTAIKSDRTTVSMTTRANPSLIPTMSKDATANVFTPTATLTEGNSTVKMLSPIFTPKMTNTTTNAQVKMVNTATIMTNPMSSTIEMVTSKTVMAMLATSTRTDPNANPQKTVTVGMNTKTAVTTKVISELSPLMTKLKQHSATARMIQFITRATTDLKKLTTAESPTTNGQLKKSLSSLHTTISTSASAPTTIGLSVVNGLPYFAKTHSFFDDPLNIAVISTIVAICGLGTISLGAYLHFCHEGGTTLCLTGIIPIRRNFNNRTVASSNSDAYNNDEE